MSLRDMRNECGIRLHCLRLLGSVRLLQFPGYAAGPAEAAALALKAGTDLECGVDYRHLGEAVERGLATEEDIDRAVKRVMMARFRLGMFDPDSIVEYAQIPYQANCSDYNRSLARQAARESIVLLKNEKRTLPLSKDIKTFAVIDPLRQMGGPGWQLYGYRKSGHGVQGMWAKLHHA